MEEEERKATLEMIPAVGGARDVIDVFYEKGLFVFLKRFSPLKIFSPRSQKDRP